MFKLDALARPDRPREKLLAHGASALSDIELLAALIGRGTRGRGVLELAKDLLSIEANQSSGFTLQHLMDLHGIGPARAIQILAAQEFFRRRIRPWGTRIRSAKEVSQVLGHLAQHKQECFVMISVNGSYELIAVRVVTIGLRERVQIHAREVFAEAISDRAYAVVLAHNHPDGPLLPSAADIRVTRRLRSAGALLGIPVLDHVIFNHTGCYSMLEHRQAGFRLITESTCDECAVYHTQPPTWPGPPETQAGRD